MVKTNMLARLMTGAALSVVAGMAAADQPLFEFGLEFGHTWRDGDAVNSSVNFDGELAEIPEYFSGALSFTGTNHFGSGLILQGGLRYERSFADEFGEDLDPGDPDPEADDTYKQGALATLQLGRVIGDTYWGGYGTVGQVSFIEPDDDQDATFGVLGAQMEYRADNWSVGGSLGYLTSDAEDEEGADEALILSGNGTYYFNNGASRLSGRLSYLDGWIDNDSPADERDELRMLEASIILENQLNWSSDRDWSAFVGLHWLGYEEKDEIGDLEKASDTYISAGIRVSLGGKGLQGRDRYQAPALPDYLRIVQAGPVVD